MNCCEQNAPYTGCNQGRDCPVRGHAAKVAPIKDRHPLPVFFAEPEPPLPVSRAEATLIWGAILVVTLTSVACIVAFSSNDLSRCLA